MPLSHVLLSILEIFLLVAWVWAVVAVISDVFRSNDLNGVARALWVLAIILVPWVGVLVYLIVHGDSMAERSAQAVTELNRNVTGRSTADELTKLAELRDKGVITEDELQAQKGKLLS